MRYFLPFFCYFLVVSTLFAQTPTQIVRGSVIDRDTRQPLLGATVKIVDAVPMLGAVTDLEGNFLIQKVTTGRHRVECSFLGYQNFVTDNLVVNSAKEVVLSIELVEAVSKGLTASEVVISAKKQGNAPVNELSTVSTRSFSVDETQRYAASANDPGRMAMGFPGVQPSRDSRSDIIVRGNSAVGLAWRLEGIDIPNPNHFARVGTSGGGITIFSTALLGQSDFSTGAFSAEYGSATSGVFDIKFRKGNADKREHTFKAGLLGLDFATEGYFKKGSRASYLVNYRYSTLGILNKMGIHLVGPRVDNTFQDLSFNLNFPSKNNKNTLGLWAIGGLSKEKSSAAKVEKWQSFDDWKQSDFRTGMTAIGLAQTHLVGDDAFLKTNFAVMSQKIFVADDTLDQQLKAGNYRKQKYYDSRATLSSVLNKRFNSKTSLKIGASASLLAFDLNSERLVNGTKQLMIENKNFGENGAFLVEPFANFRLRPTDKLTMNLGLHATYFSLNKNSKSLEPRLGVSYQLSDNQAVTIGYGYHTRILPLGAYFFTQPTGNLNAPFSLPNKDLGLLRAHHLVIGYEAQIGAGFKVHPELYFQEHLNIPVGISAGDTYSMMNTVSGFPERALTGEGTGRNFGLDLTLEKSFDRSFFLILGGSVFKSTYTDRKKVRHSTNFDSGFSASCMGGKEWANQKGSVFQVGWKILMNGGQRLSPLLANAPADRYQQDPPIDGRNPFSQQVKPYFRPDLRLAWRKNKPRAAWILALDVQNVIAYNNIDGISRSYDPVKNAWVFRKQSGLTPILSWQIDL